MSSPSCLQLDNTFRAYALSCRGGFDFTLLFEETILGILPIGLILAVAPFRISHLWQRQNKVDLSILFWIKTVSWIALGIIQIVLTALWALPSANRTKTSIAANAIFAVGAWVLCLLSCAEHVRSVKPSVFLNVYLFPSLLFDIARVRTLWLRDNGDDSRTIAILTSVALAWKAVLLVLETAEKRSILKPEYKGYPPEATGSIFNKVFFIWLIPLFKNGFSRILAVNDLFALEKQLSSQPLQDKLEPLWNEGEGENRESLLFVTFRAFKWEILSAVPPRLCLAALNICQPLLLQRSLSYSSEVVNGQTMSIGYGLIGAYILVYVGMGIMMGQYQHMTYRSITMVRGALVAMLYKKAGTLSVKEADPAAALTLMSADIERITNGWQTMHDLWGNALEIGVAIFLLERQLGVACVVPVAVSVVALLGSMIGMVFVMNRQALWLQAIEKRISATTSMLGSLKGIKMLGLQSTLMKCVHGLRLSELDISRKFRRLLVWNMGFAWLTRIFAPICAFGAFVGIKNNQGNVAAFDTSVAYTSLSLFALLSDPLLTLVMALMQFAGSAGSFARIQEFLEKKSHTDYRHKVGENSKEGLEDTKSLTLVAESVAADSDIAPSDSVSTQSLKLKRPGSSVNVDAIAVRNGTFSWDVEKEPTLSDLTLAIPKGNFTMLIGPSGCGKSTLIKSLLGEVQCVNGNVELLSKSIAYCEQTPWHMNGSIQDSIIAMSDLDERWYSTVLHACALQKDFEQLPRGDQTTIGSKGMALSGGQSQRIALARAVYARKEILLLDDGLSGLDAATENHIFHNVFGEHGLLREIGTTVVFASSSVKRLPYSDQVIVLSQDGHVLEQGSFKALNATGGYVSSFALGPAEWNYDYKAAIAASSDAFRAPISSPHKAEDIGAEEHGNGGDLSIYLYYIRSIGWLPSIFFTVMIAAFVFCLSFPSIWVKWWAASNEEDPNGRTAYYVGIYAMICVVGMITLLLGTWEMIIDMVPKSGESFHRRLLTTVLNAPMLFLSSTDSGSLLNRFSQDLQLIDMELPVAAINTVAIQKIYLRTSRQLRFMDIEAKAPLFSHFTDCLNGLATLRAYGWQHAMEEKNRRLLDYSQRPFYLLYAIQRWLTLTLDMVVAGIAIVLIVLVVALRGTISTGYVGVALLNVIQFSQSIKLVVTFWTNLETHIGSIMRVKTFTEKVQSEDLPDENGSAPVGWPSKGDIKFESVSASYKPDEPVLSDVSLSIQAGEKIGICGRTGSGKTSMIMSLFRMVELTSGSITVDGMDISKLPRQQIRSCINGVSQDPLLIKGTVRMNADPTGCCFDRDILDALKSVHLLSTIEENEAGLDADIDDLHLSHGQKQLFCLARAILRPGRILVLDEATSNVDTKTDEIMQRVIREKFGNHTIIAIAHNLETIMDYDRIVVLDGGRLVESGSPYTLLTTDDSYFAKLYASAMKEESE
ncbi:hypothetical protein MW887_002008 [Aspergillus wentii]|nr:hypothetical protein MW887_002008 [Aspergillus wentii]